MQRLDKFYGKLLHKNQQYKSMWKFFFIFTLSHGQSQVERGFSINKEIVIENLHSSSLSTQRIAFNYLKASKKNIHNIEITNKMVTSCKSAHSRYLIALEDAKRQSQATEKETKHKLIKTEIADINPLSANLTKWPNTLKQFVGKLPTNCLSVFDHFVRLALQVLSHEQVCLSGLRFERYFSHHRAT